MKKSELLNKTTAKALGLDIIVRDRPSFTDKEIKGRLKGVADWYIALNRGFLVMLNGDWIGNAWEWFDRENFSYNSPAEQLEKVMPNWLAIVCPQAGGLLEPVKFRPPPGNRLPGASKLSYFVHDSTTYFVPARQVFLVRRYWPEAVFSVGPHLVGRDLFGEVMTRPSPVIASTEEEGAIAAIMLWK